MGRGSAFVASGGVEVMLPSFQKSEGVVKRQ